MSYAFNLKASDLHCLFLCFQSKILIYTLFVMGYHYESTKLSVQVISF